MRNRTSDLRIPRSDALQSSALLGKGTEKDVFRLVTSVGQRKNCESLSGTQPIALL